MRLCLDLNIWCASILAARLGRADTACQVIVDAARSGTSSRGPVQLVISWGMLNRLAQVLERQLGFPSQAAEGLVDAIADYAREGPSLTLGGVGVIPITDAEDRHVLETAWAGRSDVLVTADFRGFVGQAADVLDPDRLAVLGRGAERLHLAHPFVVAAWLRGEEIAGLTLA